MKNSKIKQKISKINRLILFSYSKFIHSCVLIITGSFNPIHRSHIYNLQLVKKYLENHDTRSMNVLAAYISPTQYVLFYNVCLILNF